MSWDTVKRSRKLPFPQQHEEFTLNAAAFFYFSSASIFPRLRCCCGCEGHLPAPARARARARESSPLHEDDRVPTQNRCQQAVGTSEEDQKTSSVDGGGQKFICDCQQFWRR